MAKRSLFRRVLSCVLCVSMLFSFSSCEENDSDGTASRVPLSFSELNTRGNSNGNIANMALGVTQGEWIIFSDLGSGQLKATRDKGKHCITLMEDLQDMFACLNLIGQELDYISPLYGDINTVDLENEMASSLIGSSSYCLQRIDGHLYYIDESGDGLIHRVDCATAENEAVSSHKAYIEGVTTESAHASFSIDNGYLYYAAADDGFAVYRIDLDTKEEVKLCGDSASILIVENGHIIYKNADNGKLCSLSDGGEKKELTKAAVGTFNFDGTYIYYTDLSTASKTVMKMRRTGGSSSVFCDAADTMYINLLGDTVMLYCVNGNGEDPRTVFVSSDGEVYRPA